MPRQPRYLLPGFPQHVIQRGNNRQPTFRSRRDFALYKHYLAESARNHKCSIHAYVLMTNHVHLVVTPQTATGIPKLMQSLGRRYVYYFNKTHARTGTLWEGRYKACLIDSDCYLITCCRYVELNPVRAGIVSDPTTYPHSSYCHNVGLGRDALVTPHERYLALGSNIKKRNAAYKELSERPLDCADLDKVRAATNSCLVLGSNSFCDLMEQTLARPVRKQRAGRRPVQRASTRRP